MLRYPPRVVLPHAFALFVYVFAIESSAQTAREVLTSSQWQSVDVSVDRALDWLASTQQRDGSFPTVTHGQPAVTSFCVMAFAAHGHLPGEGRYGQQLEEAVEFIVRCQKPNGLLAWHSPNGTEISRNVPQLIGSRASYNHAISGLLLSEVFAISGHGQEQRGKVIEQAVKATLKMQVWPKRRKEDEGGWRYVNLYGNGRFDSDLSVSGWHLMFLRSAKNAGFEVPEESIKKAIAYVLRCFQPEFDTFTIMASPADRRSRGMAGAGILALAHAGLHDTKEARLAGDWLLKEGFATYNESRDYAHNNIWIYDRYHYGVFLASQAMYQLGGKYWQPFFPPTIKVILQNQNPDGSWAPDKHPQDRAYGNHYTTSLMLLTLGAPNQLLPIFQR